MNSVMPIFKFPNTSNALLAFLFLVFQTIPLHAQVKLKEHRKLVQESAASGTALHSLDTLFCGGKAIAKVVVTAKTGETILEQAIMAFNSQAPVIIVNSISLSNKSGLAETYHHFEFPGIGRSCDVRYKNNSEAYDLICKYGLLNLHGLDTVKAEMFATVKGVAKSTGGSRLDTINSDKSLVVKRDTKAEILFEKEEIAQGGVLIGSFKENTISGPGGELRQLIIYNSVGALICTATRTDKAGNSWSLLTYKDNRFNSAKFTSENDLKELVTYLIERGYL